MAQANKGRTQPQGRGDASLRGIASRLTNFMQTYRHHFNVAHQNVSDNARAYTTGLVTIVSRKNMERMEECVKGCTYPSLQQFVSDSPWGHEPLNKHIGCNAHELLGGPGSVLAVDESGFGKKGKMAVGVARQWNGREGKTDNCQVGVYAALSDGVQATLVDYRLYLPKEWTEDKERCLKAKIPEEKCVFKTKPELAVEMVETALANGLLFGWVAMDAFYGQVPTCVRRLDRSGLNCVADVHRNQIVYTEDPRPYLPRRKNRQGRKPTQLQARTDGIRVDALYKKEESASWNTIRVRRGTKGVVFVQAHRRRVWLWDGEEKTARHWWLVVIRDRLTGEIKWFISNAAATVSLTTLVQKRAARFWIERAFQDAKTSLGMADYQARGWIAWHHHMSLVMLALLFLFKERLRHKQAVPLLSCQDIVELLNHYLPRKDLTEEAVMANLKHRHRARQRDIDSAYRRQQNQHTNNQ